jgi:hypothetical protein
VLSSQTWIKSPSLGPLQTQAHWILPIYGGFFTSPTPISIRGHSLHLLVQRALVRMSCVSGTRDGAFCPWPKFVQILSTTPHSIYPIRSTLYGCRVIITLYGVWSMECRVGLTSYDPACPGSRSSASLELFARTWRTVKDCPRLHYPRFAGCSLYMAWHGRQYFGHQAPHQLGKSS